MNIKKSIDEDKSFYIDTIKRILHASESFARKTNAERQAITQSAESCKKFFNHAGVNGLAFLLLSNNSAASNNELDLLESLSPQEALLVAGAGANLESGKAIDDGLPTLSDKIKLLAQQHIISSQINELSESKYNAEFNYDYTVGGDGSIKDIKAKPDNTTQT